MRLARAPRARLLAILHDPRVERLFDEIARQGYAVEFARSHDEVLARIGRGRFDAVILDLGDGPHGASGQVDVAYEPRRSPMERVFQQVRHIAPTDEPVLLVGEAATGRRTIAARIVRESRRSTEPFRTLSCHRATAGEARDLLRRMSAGTVLFHEIELAGEELRAEIVRCAGIGSGRRHESPRLIATASAHVIDDISRAGVRSHLLYGLAGALIRIPSLRERQADLPALGQELMRRVSERLGVTRRLTKSAAAVLQGHSWPGNFIELESVLESAAILSSRRMVTLADLRRALPALQEVPPETLEGAQRRHIQSVLRWAGGNKLKAARALGIPRSTLYRLLNRIDSPTRR